MLYRLGTWEDNGYHDSYFYASAWNSETNQVESIMTGATAFAGGPTIDWQPLTPEVLESARQWLEQAIFNTLRKAEDNDVLAPQNVEIGVRVQLLESHRNRPTIKEDCPKCEGGYWVNPKNSEDKRPCFSCDGVGFIAKTGKGKLETFAEGTAGEVFWTGTPGRTFYRNGYNRPDRGTIQCKIKLDDGRLLKAPLSKLRLDKEPMSDEELQRRSLALSYSYRFNSACGMKAWSTTENAAAYAASIGADKCPIEVAGINC